MNTDIVNLETTCVPVALWGVIDYQDSRDSLGLK